MEIKTTLDLLNTFLKENNLRVKWEDFVQDNGIHLTNGFGVERVYVTQDDDGHWYVIPYELKDEFIAAVENLIFAKKTYEQELTTETEMLMYDAESRFDSNFLGYETGGDINLIELYAKI